MITLKYFENEPKIACLWVKSCPKENNINIRCTKCQAHDTSPMDAEEAIKWWKNRIKELNEEE